MGWTSSISFQSLLSKESRDKTQWNKLTTGPRCHKSDVTTLVFVILVGLLGFPQILLGQWSFNPHNIGPKDEESRSQYCQLGSDQIIPLEKVILLNEERPRAEALASFTAPLKVKLTLSMVSHSPEESPPEGYKPILFPQFRIQVFKDSSPEAEPIPLTWGSLRALQIKQAYKRPYRNWIPESLKTVADQPLNFRLLPLTESETQPASVTLVNTPWGFRRSQAFLAFFAYQNEIELTFKTYEGQQFRVPINLRKTHPSLRKLSWHCHPDPTVAQKYLRLTNSKKVTRKASVFGDFEFEEGYGMTRYIAGPLKKGTTSTLLENYGYESLLPNGLPTPLKFHSDNQITPEQLNRVVQKWSRLAQLLEQSYSAQQAIVSQIQDPMFKKPVEGLQNTQENLQNLWNDQITPLIFPQGPNALGLLHELRQRREFLAKKIQLLETRQGQLDKEEIPKMEKNYERAQAMQTLYGLFLKYQKRRQDKASASDPRPFPQPPTEYKSPLFSVDEIFAHDSVVDMMEASGGPLREINELFNQALIAIPRLLQLAEIFFEINALNEKVSADLTWTNEDTKWLHVDHQDAEKEYPIFLREDFPNLNQEVQQKLFRLQSQPNSPEFKGLSFCEHTEEKENQSSPSAQQFFDHIRRQHRCLLDASYRQLTQTLSQAEAPYTSSVLCRDAHDPQSSQFEGSPVCLSPVDYWGEMAKSSFFKSPSIAAVDSALSLSPEDLLQYNELCNAAEGDQPSKSQCLLFILENERGHIESNLSQLKPEMLNLWKSIQFLHFRLTAIGALEKHQEQQQSQNASQATDFLTPCRFDNRSLLFHEGQHHLPEDYFQSVHDSYVQCATYLSEDASAIESERQTIVVQINEILKGVNPSGLASQNPEDLLERLAQQLIQARQAYNQAAQNFVKTYIEPTLVLYQRLQQDYNISLFSPIDLQACQFPIPKVPSCDKAIKDRLPLVQQQIAYGGSNKPAAIEHMVWSIVYAMGELTDQLNKSGTPSPLQLSGENAADDTKNIVSTLSNAEARLNAVEDELAAIALRLQTLTQEESTAHERVEVISHQLALHIEEAEVMKDTIRSFQKELTPFCEQLQGSFTQKNQYHQRIHELVTGDPLANAQTAAHPACDTNILNQYKVNLH